MPSVGGSTGTGKTFQNRKPQAEKKTVALYVPARLYARAVRWWPQVLTTVLRQALPLHVSLFLLRVLVFACDSSLSYCLSIVGAGKSLLVREVAVAAAAARHTVAQQHP